MSLDLQKLADDCKIAQNCSSETISLLTALENKYPQEELVEIYNHFLSMETDPTVLQNIIRCIDKIRDPSSMDVLFDLLLMKDKFQSISNSPEDYVNVRVMATKCLANFKDTKAVLPLLYCLNNKDENYKIRLSCAEALGKIGDKYAVAPLLEVVSDESEKSVYIKESAVMALGMIGDMRAVDTLVSILETKKGFMDKFTFLKERALEALGKFNFHNERVMKALKNSLMDESAQVRISAIEALMNTEDDRAVLLIKQMLKDQDEEVVKNAVIALYNLVGSDILTEILESDDASVICKREAQSLYDEYEFEEIGEEIGEEIYDE